MKISTFMDCLHEEQIVRICNLDKKILYEGKKDACPEEINNCKIIPQSVVQGGTDSDFIIFVK